MLLLSTRALLDLVWEDPGLATLLDSYRMDQVYISVISLGRAIEVVNQVDPTDPKFHDYVSTLQSIIGFARAKDKLLAFDEHFARRWSELMPMDLDAYNSKGETVPLGDDSRQVLATAWQANLQLVEPTHPYHQVLTTGLRIVFQAY